MFFVAQLVGANASWWDSSTILYILKYTGSVFAALYGLYATITDFHEHRNHKKVLSRKGYVGIGILLIASVLSISSDAYKDHKEQKEKEEQKQKDEEARRALERQLGREIEETKKIANELTDQQQKLSDAVDAIDQNAETTLGVLNQTERIMQPIKDVSVTYDILVPVDDADVKAMVSNIKIHGDPLRTADGRFLTCPMAVVNPPDESQYPIAHQALDLVVLSVAFYRTAIPARETLAKLEKTHPPAYAFETVTHASSHPGTGVHVITYDAHGRLILSVTRESPDPSTGFERKTFALSSVPDLLRARVLITLGPQIPHSSPQIVWGPPLRSGDPWAVRKKVSISNLALRMYGQQQSFVFNAKTVKPILNDDGYPVYYGRFSELFRQAPSPFGPKASCD